MTGLNKVLPSHYQARDLNFEIGLINIGIPAHFGYSLERRLIS